MLLLLRGAVSALPAGNAGILLGVNGIAGPTGKASINLGAATNGQIELNVFGTANTRINVSGIPIGFLTSTGNASISVDTIGFGGFGFVARGDIQFNVTGTVGSTLQGIGAATVTFSDSGVARILTTASTTIALNVAGAPTLSGGTLTPVGSTSLTFNVNGIPYLGTTGLADIDLNAQGTGFPSIVGLATEMQLTFESDDMRLFFRKG